MTDVTDVTDTTDTTATVKPGWRTTEFWLSVAATGLTLLLDRSRDCYPPKKRTDP
jgi:hypothetical protein